MSGLWTRSRPITPDGWTETPLSLARTGPAQAGDDRFDSGNGPMSETLNHRTSIYADMAAAMKRQQWRAIFIEKRPVRTQAERRQARARSAMAMRGGWL